MIPTEFQLMGEVWGVQSKWGLRHGGEFVDGYCEPSSRTIFLDRALSRGDRGLVLFREIVRGVEFEVGLVDGDLAGRLADEIFRLYGVRWKG